MKQILLLFIGLVFFSAVAPAQITTPVIRAGFGVDADLRANYFNGFVQSGNDDWFNNGTAGTGRYVIDTTGAAALVAAYLADPGPAYTFRNTPVYRSMSVPNFSVINNRLWYDAIWVRDHHGKDSTAFSAGSNKNGDSPETWSGTVNGIPDKNDILDVSMHLRRAGPTTSDSLWMFCGMSLDNVTGNRYFDFELYQTDIYYDKASGDWFGYGPNMGHTAWEFDAAGNVTKVGDIIFSSSFQSSTLSTVEARIWVAQTSLSVTPAQFNWGGLYDGAYNGAPYGYASIQPKIMGTFYTGLGCNNNTWAGPFRLLLQDNSMVVNYVRDQYMEFSVNLTKLGVDPATLFGTDICGTPFNRLVVKTRSSESFTSELKDFIAPLSMFLAQRAEVVPEVPMFCNDTATSFIYVSNPHASSLYTWTTPDGNIITPPTGTWIQVNQPGTYIVTQRLAAGCAPYAIDSTTVIREQCDVLAARFKSFSGAYRANERNAALQWTVQNNSSARSFIIEASTDGGVFREAGTISADNTKPDEASYYFNYNIPVGATSFVDFRIKMIEDDGTYTYSRVLRISIKSTLKATITVAPNPVRERFQISVTSSEDVPSRILFFDMNGRQVKAMNETLRKGVNVFGVDINANWQPGVYNALVKIKDETFSTRFVVLE